MCQILGHVRIFFMQQNVIAQTFPNRLRIPPQNLEAEMALLGSIMLRPEVLFDIMEVVALDSFYSEKHKVVFETMMELFNKHSPIDLLSVSTKLKEKGWLDQIGGNTYLTELVNVVPSSSNVGYYAEIVQKKFMMRRLIDASDNISQIGYDENKELDEMLDTAEKKLFDVTQSHSSHKFVSLKDELNEAWERLDKLHTDGQGMRGTPTGFADLDFKLAGFQKSDLIILAARPSMGKTALALDIARQTAINHGTSVGIFSLEMSSQQLVDRMLAAQSNVDAWKMRTGKLSRNDDFELIRNGLEQLSKAPIFIDDQPGNSIIKMRSVARRLKSEKGLGLIIVDYLQLMVPAQSKNDNLVQQTTEISRSLKHLARELDVPVLALSQLSRAVEARGGRPRLSDLRDSGSIEQDADVVMFIHREDKYKDETEKTNIAEIMIEKHRNGETGKIELFFNEKKATFQSMDKSQYGGAEKAFSDF